MIFCDGNTWNGTLRQCVKSTGSPEPMCNFNHGSFCGWTQLSSPRDDTDWQMTNVSCSSSGTKFTGMSSLNPYSDHYLLFESSDLSWNATAAIFSPVYTRKQEEFCFSLQFSMNGANMGSLRVYLLQENDDNFKEKEPIATFIGNHGPRLILWTTQLRHVYSTFQVAIVANRGFSYLRYVKCGYSKLHFRFVHFKRRPKNEIRVGAQCFSFYFSDMTINYVEVFNDQDRCNALIAASNITFQTQTDDMSPESCANRCHTNITDHQWSEGFCTCNGDHHDCGDFVDLCGTFIDTPPKFFKSIGLTSWLHLAIASVSGIIILSLTTCLFVRIMKNRSSSSIMERTKRGPVRIFHYFI